MRNFEKLFGRYDRYGIALNEGNILVRPTRELGHGGFGSVYEVEYDDGQPPRTSRLAVLKFLSPNHANNEAARNDFDADIKVIKELGISAAPRFISAGSLTIRRTDKMGDEFVVPYYLVDHIPNTITLDELIRKSADAGIDEKFIFDLTEAAIKGYEKLQQADILHLDIHPKNILIGFEEEVTESVIQKTICTGVYFIDYGKARKVRHEEEGPKRFPGDFHRRYWHPDLAKMFDDKHFISTKFATHDAFRFDMFALAICLKELWEMYNSRSHALEALGQVIESFQNKNSKVDFQVTQALRKVVRLKSNIAETPVLIRLAGGASVQVHKEFLALINTPEFQRLRNIQQLGLTHLVYPSATHTRFSHSIGVFHMAQRYWDALLKNSSYAGYQFDDQLKQRFLAHALLHDIGHYPFAHYFEECLEEDVSATNEDELNKRKWVKVNNEFIPFPLHHEELGCRLLAGDILIDNDEHLDISNNDPVKRRTKTAQSTDKNELHKNFERYFNRRELLDSYNSIVKEPVVSEMLSGVIDCDKVDYLIRDGMACGVPYAQGIDIDRLLSGLTVALYPDNSDKLRLAVSEKGLAPVDSILSARYHLFSEVYWHKVCRATAAMLKFALIQAIGWGRLSVDQFTYAAMNLGDTKFLEYLYEILVSTPEVPDAKEAARELIADLLWKRKFYKRLITFSRPWEPLDKGPFDKITGKIGSNGDYSRVCAVQNKIRVKLEARINIKIPPHRLLLDVPPFTRDKEITQLVVFEDGKQVKPIHDVSGIHYAPGKDRTQTPLYHTQRIRIFASETLVAQIKLARFTDMRKLFEEIIKEL